MEDASLWPRIGTEQYSKGTALQCFLLTWRLVPLAHVDGVGFSAIADGK